MSNIFFRNKPTAPFNFPFIAATSEEHHKLKSLLRQFIANDFSTRVFNGQDYDDDESAPAAVQAQTEVDQFNTTTTKVAPAISHATYGPPCTFRSDNNTRRPLRLQLPALTYKSGILLLQFTSACALNVLRWAAAAEHNYFTTNRFWLLFTDEPAHISLLDDEGIFLPPDGEVRIMLQQPGAQFFTLVDVYKIAADKPLRHTSVGGGELRDVQDMLQALSKFGSAISYRQNLEGITFKTGLVIAFPDMFTNIEDLSLRHIDTISKVNNRLTLELANKLNLR